MPLQRLDNRQLWSRRRYNLPAMVARQTSLRCGKPLCQLSLYQLPKMRFALPAIAPSLQLEREGRGSPADVHGQSLHAIYLPPARLSCQILHICCRLYELLVWTNPWISIACPVFLEISTRRSYDCLLHNCFKILIWHRYHCQRWLHIWRSPWEHLSGNLLEALMQHRSSI